MIGPDDERHGSTRGYAQGCRQPCCREAQNEYERNRRKRRQVLGEERAIPATGTRRRLRALMAIGHTSKTIAAECGWGSGEAVLEVTKRAWVQQKTADTVAEVYERLSMTPGNSAGTRHRAASKGWIPPLGWNDIDHDPDVGQEVALCRVSDCANHRRSKGYCDKHYRKWLRYGNPEGAARRGRPRGDSATYMAVHLRLARDRGPAKNFPCVDCGGPARTWSYNHQDPDVHVDEQGRPYSLDQNFYQARCDGCHNLYDNAPKNNRRRENVIELAELGENATQIARRLGIGVFSLERWCMRHMPDVWRQISAREGDWNSTGNRGHQSRREVA